MDLVKTATRQVIAERLDQLLDEHQQSASALADRFNRSRGWLSNWRTGRNIPPADELADLCRELDVSADFVLGLSDLRHTDDGKVIRYSDAAAETSLPAVVSEASHAYGSEEQPISIVVSAYGREWVPIPKFRDPVSAGGLVFPEEAIDEVRLATPAQLRGYGIRGPLHSNRIFLIEVSQKASLGSSMLPTILPGAELWCDRGPDLTGPPYFSEGEIYLVREPRLGGITCKRVWLTETERGLELNCHADNRSVPPFAIAIPDRDAIRQWCIARVVRVNNPTP